MSQRFIRGLRFREPEVSSSSEAVEVEDEVSSSISESSGGGSSSSSRSSSSKSRGRGGYSTFYIAGALMVALVAGGLVSYQTFKSKEK